MNPLSSVLEVHRDAPTVDALPFQSSCHLKPLSDACPAQRPKDDESQIIIEHVLPNEPVGNGQKQQGPEDEQT